MLACPTPNAPQTPAQAAVQAMRAEGAAAHAAAQGMVAQVAASARGRAEALQGYARDTAREAMAPTFMTARLAAQNGNSKEDVQGLKLQWCAPSLNNNSFV